MQYANKSYGVTLYKLHNFDSCKELLKTLDIANSIGENVGHGTENGIWLAFDEIIKSKESFDRIFIYSDMQAGHGGLYGLKSSKYPIWKNERNNRMIDVPMLIKKYRETVNDNCHVYSVQIGGYSDNIIPEFYPKTSILSGWSQELLRFASFMEQGSSNIEKVFREKFKNMLTK